MSGLAAIHAVTLLAGAHLLLLMGVLMHLVLVRGVVVVVRSMLAGMGMGMCFPFTIVLMHVLMLMDVLVGMLMLVLVRVDDLSVLVRVGMDMLVRVHMQMDVLVFSFHCSPPWRRGGWRSKHTIRSGRPQSQGPSTGRSPRAFLLKHCRLRPGRGTIWHGQPAFP